MVTHLLHFNWVYSCCFLPVYRIKFPTKSFISRICYSSLVFLAPFHLISTLFQGISYQRSHCQCWTSPLNFLPDPHFPNQPLYPPNTAPSNWDRTLNIQISVRYYHHIRTEWTPDLIILVFQLSWSLLWTCYLPKFVKWHRHTWQLSRNYVLTSSWSLQAESVMTGWFLIAEYLMWRMAIWKSGTSWISFYLYKFYPW